jgi:hypothetical protein
VADYTHLTALLAPRPALLTYNARDNCCFVAQSALEPLVGAASPVYKLFGKEQNLRWHVNYDPGDHNFGQDNREAFYRMLRDHFHGGDPAFAAAEIPCDAEVKAHTNLLVELPGDNATFNSLARRLAQDLPRQDALPTNEAVARKWQKEPGTIAGDRSGKIARCHTNANRHRQHCGHQSHVLAISSGRFVDHPRRRTQSRHRARHERADR